MADNAGGLKVRTSQAGNRSAGLPRHHANRNSREKGLREKCR